MSVTTAPRPACRRLSIYAFDPSFALSNHTSSYATATIGLPWGELFDAPMEPGPVNEYLEVVDIDPASGLFYPPVDLEDRYLLATDGLAPSESNPQFHQQMTFAVAMRTITAFETALGRRVLWSIKRDGWEYVPRLRVYPHALREENAYYSPSKKALLFGYYPAAGRDASTIAGMPVFACLSHDIVAHETTHAILDGINPRLIEDVSADSLAFHEGFADIVALLQHFTFKDAVRAGIAAATGLDAPSLLSGLAQQFGNASRRRTDDMPDGPLRDAMANRPDKHPADLNGYREAHARGARLLSAVYAALVEIYQQSASELLAIAPPARPGARLHPQLVDKLAEAATRAASNVLALCIRALDYLPPNSITFGDFLRAIVSADYDLFAVDLHGYRRAIIAAFRCYGVVPEGVRSLAEDSLLWERVPARANPCGPLPGEEAFDLDPLFKREAIFRQAERNGRALHRVLHALMIGGDHALLEHLGLTTDLTGMASLYVDDRAPERPSFQVHSFRTARRMAEGGPPIRPLVVAITQTRRGYFDPEVQRAVDASEVPPPPEDFKLRGGVTIVIDLRGYRSPRSVDPTVDDDHASSIFDLPRWVIRQPVASAERLAAMRAHLRQSAGGSLGFTYGQPIRSGYEPLAMLHAELVRSDG